MSSSGAVVPYEKKHTHTTRNPMASMAQNSSGRAYCGVDAVLSKAWSFNSAGLYQVDAITAGNWVALALPANVTMAGGEAKVATFTPASGANAGLVQMFLLALNGVSGRYEIYSAPPGLKTVAPTWSALLQQFQANAIMIPTAFKACSTGMFAGEYTGTPDIAGNVNVYRSVDGIIWTTVLSLPAGAGATRHIHSIYEDPYHLGTIYVQVGDYGGIWTPPFSLYKSTDGGATFTGVPGMTIGTWQAVSMGFTSDYIWCCSDQTNGAGPYLLDRATLTPRWATTKARQDNIAVPMGIGGRQVVDAVFNSTTLVTSNTANFSTTGADTGRALLGNNACPLGNYIASVNTATSANMALPATNTSAGNALIIGGDQFYATAYAGAIDPASGWLYIVANDATAFGNVAGLFLLTAPDEPFALLQTLPLASVGHHEVFIAGGFLFIDRYGPMPLFTGTS